MTKSDRQKIFDKYGGRCAYCGFELKKGWCVDHVEPVGRTTKMQPGYYRHKETKEKCSMNELPEKWWGKYEYINPKQVFDKFTHPERDTIENSMPSCFSCNSYKSTMSIDNFKEQIWLLIGRLNKSFTQYKVAKRYGLVHETGIEVKFYFETINPDTLNPK